MNLVDDCPQRAVFQSRTDIPSLDCTPFGRIEMLENRIAALDNDTAHAATCNIAEIRNGRCLVIVAGSCRAFNHAVLHRDRAQGTFAEKRRLREVFYRIGGIPAVLRINPRIDRRSRRTRLALNDFGRFRALFGHDSRTACRQHAAAEKARPQRRNACTPQEITAADSFMLFHTRLHNPVHKSPFSILVPLLAYVA